jgi:hypothetical protein
MRSANPFAAAICRATSMAGFGSTAEDASRRAELAGEHREDAGARA